ncbi:MAG: hypothetical protein JWQ22_601 [Devosia sp.]|nr:hypothetical protein [Devosia sp.]
MHAFERMVGGQRWLLLVSRQMPEAFPQKFKGQTWSPCLLSKIEADKLKPHCRDVRDLGYAVVYAPPESPSD